MCVCVTVKFALNDSRCASFCVLSLTRKVTIMEDPEQNIHLKNLSLQPSTNEEEALNLLFLGDTNRMIAEVRLTERWDDFTGKAAQNVRM